MLKWLGGTMIVSSCAAAGFLMAARYRMAAESLRQLIRALDYMQCELQYHLTPLPQLCRQAGREVRGYSREILNSLADDLEQQIRPDAGSCMNTLLAVRELPERLKTGFDMLGSTLGRFDLDGQLTGLESVRNYCRSELAELDANREQRIRSYQTLGLCTGAALAILLV